MSACVVCSFIKSSTLFQEIKLNYFYIKENLRDNNKNKVNEKN